MCWPHTGLNTAQRGPLTGCSNCTRLLAHEKKRYVMTPEQFRQIVLVARDFIYESPPCPQGRINKVLGIFGGEPLMSPYFADYVNILCELVPEPIHRGLWTSFDWTQHSGKWGPTPPVVHKLLGTVNGKHQGYLNWNMHEPTNKCEHHPQLVAIQDVIKDEAHRWELINQCWLNRDWSAAYALDFNDEPKFYFCEIASGMDRVMRLGTGLPIEKGIWAHDLILAPDERGILQPQGIYAEQVKSSCLRCGQALPAKQGRRDLELKDDISPSNLITLQQIESPMVLRGDYVLFGDEQIAAYNEAESRKGYEPWRYIKEGVRHSTNVQHRATNPAVPSKKKGKKVVIKRGRKRK